MRRDLPVAQRRERAQDVRQVIDLMPQESADDWAAVADRRRVLTPVWRTADWTYLRFHEGRATPRPRYGRQALQTWADRLIHTYPAREDVYVYLNNDPGGAAIVDAEAIASALARRGAPVVGV